MPSPTSRSLALLREQGWKPDVVERFNSFTKRRHDLYGFGDILAIRQAEEGCFAIVQTTSGSNLAARRTKILANETARAWLKIGGRIILHGWRKSKNGVRGGRLVWGCREEEVTLEDYEP